MRLRYTDARADARRSPTSTRSSTQRIAEADEFYEAIDAATSSATDERRVYRAGDGGPPLEQAVLPLRRRALAARRPGAPRRRPSARNGRNREWRHLYNSEVLSMPDKWEYPWYAAWDLAFHCIPLALVDPEFAKQQLTLLAARVVHAPERAAPGVRVGSSAT